MSYAPAWGVCLFGLFGLFFLLQDTRYVLTSSRGLVGMSMYMSLLFHTRYCMDWGKGGGGCMSVGHYCAHGVGCKRRRKGGEKEIGSSTGAGGGMERWKLGFLDSGG